MTTRIQDSKELSEETRQNLKEAEANVKSWRVVSHEELKKELGL